MQNHQKICNYQTLEGTADRSIASDWIIILVHGTFARGAEWTKPKSSFRLRLEQSFPCAEIKIYEWSGANSHSHRLRAGQLLAEMLKSSYKSNPEKKHILIGHSHGGNVILYATRDSEIRKI